MPRENIRELYAPLATRADEGQAGHRNAEAFEVGSAQTEVDLATVVADAGDLPYRIGADQVGSCEGLAAKVDDDAAGEGGRQGGELESGCRGIAAGLNVLVPRLA